MFNLTHSARLRQVLTATQNAGAALPKPVREAVDRQERHHATIAAMAEPHDLAATVLAALDSGGDPAADPAVQRALAAMSLAETRDILLAGIERETIEIVADNADAIVRAWSKPYDTAAAALAAAFDQLGTVDLADAPGVLTRGAEAPNAWLTAREAQQTIAGIIGAWAHLGAIAGVVTDTDPHKPLRMAALSLEQWRAVDHRHASAWDLLAVGAVLSLPTVDEYRERVLAVEGAITAERQHAEGVEGYRDAKRAGVW